MTLCERGVGKSLGFPETKVGGGVYACVCLRACHMSVCGTCCVG